MKYVNEEESSDAIISAITPLVIENEREQARLSGRDFCLGLMQARSMHASARFVILCRAVKIDLSTSVNNSRAW